MLTVVTTVSFLLPCRERERCVATVWALETTSGMQYVHFYGARRQVEEPGDLFRLQMLRDESENLAFTRGQGFERWLTVGVAHALSMPPPVWHV